MVASESKVLATFHGDETFPVEWEEGERELFWVLDGFDTENASLPELAVLFEDAIDVHDRHWKIHWMLNFAQFSATMALGAAIQELKPDAEPGLAGRLQSSVADRNWDSIEALWRMKEEIKGDPELAAAFEGETAADVGRALEGSERGQACG